MSDFSEFEERCFEFARSVKELIKSSISIFNFFSISILFRFSAFLCFDFFAFR